MALGRAAAVMVWIKPGAGFVMKFNMRGENGLTWSDTTDYFEVGQSRTVTLSNGRIGGECWPLATIWTGGSFGRLIGMESDDRKTHEARDNVIYDPNSRALAIYSMSGSMVHPRFDFDRFDSYFNAADGRRFHDSAVGKLYVQIEGTLRHIPNPDTFNRLFKDWIYEDISAAGGAPIGPPLSLDACLARARPVRGKVQRNLYFVSNNEKRLIAGMDVFERYHFALDKVQEMDLPSKSGTNLT